MQRGGREAGKKRRPQDSTPNNFLGRHHGSAEIRRHGSTGLPGTATIEELSESLQSLRERMLPRTPPEAKLCFVETVQRPVSLAAAADFCRIRKMAKDARREDQLGPRHGSAMP